MLDRFAIISDLDVTPVRIRGIPWALPTLHVRATQISPPASRALGRTRCGGIVAPPFDKDAYLNDASSRGVVEVDGDIAAGAVHLDHISVSRALKSVIAGNVVLKDLDLRPPLGSLFPRTRGKR